MGVGEAIGTITDRIVAPVSGMHRTIAAQWLRPLGASGRSVRNSQDTVIALAYGSVRLAGRMAGRGVDWLASPAPLLTSRVDAVVDGLWGADRPYMSLRDRHGRPDFGRQAGQTPPSTSTSNIVVLVHGLVETEQCFAAGDPSLLDEIERHPALTPLLVRYSSGSTISENGAQLAVLLDRVHSEWPVPVDSIILVGHSMGGLVIRSACAVAAAKRSPWIDDVVDVVTIASPHLGSPLEKLAHLAARGLGTTAVTTPLAEFLDSRSDGVKDLRFGSVAAAEPTDRSTGGQAAANPPSGTPLPRGIRHHFIGGSVTGDPGHPVGAALGDLVVRQSSSTGGRHLEPTTRLVVGGVSHRTMLRHPVVIDTVMGCITEPSA